VLPVCRRAGLAACTIIGTLIAPAVATGAAGSTQAVTIRHGQFEPGEVRVSAGETVTWTNKDEDGHSVTADDGSFDSSPGCSTTASDRCLGPGQTYSHTFPKPGRFPYHSNTEGQHGTVIVG
jgi:plastocyanin